MWSISFLTSKSCCFFDWISSSEYLFLFKEANSFYGFGLIHKFFYYCCSTTTLVCLGAREGLVAGVVTLVIWLTDKYEGILSLLLVLSLTASVFFGGEHSNMYL